MRTGTIPGRSLVARALREPLVHFLLIGVAVFALYRDDPRSPATAVERVIEVTPMQVDRLAGQFEAVWRRPPTETEAAGLVEDFVREEVYYREAVALRLDRDDTVVRRRLRQKMDFRGDAGAGSQAPDDAELRAHFEARLERFTPPPRVTFRQVFLGDAAAAPVLAALEGGADPRELGSGTLLPPAMEAAPEAAVDGTFGNGFFAAVAGMEAGVWTGPVDSAFGRHLVQLLEAEPATPPRFASVRGAVEDDWRRQAAEALREEQYRALPGRYEVVLPEASKR